MRSFADPPPPRARACSRRGCWCVARPTAGALLHALLAFLSALLASLAATTLPWLDPTSRALPGLRYATLWEACSTGFDAASLAAASRLASDPSASAAQTSSDPDDAVESLRAASAELDVALFHGAGACEPTGGFLRRAFRVARDAGRGDRPDALSPRGAFWRFQTSRSLALLLVALAAAQLILLAAFALAPDAAPRRLHRPRAVLLAAALAHLCVGLGAWTAWRVVVRGLAAVADVEWPARASDKSEHYAGSGHRVVLAAAALGVAAGAVACVAIPFEGCRCGRGGGGGKGGCGRGGGCCARPAANERKRAEDDDAEPSSSRGV